jgi:hypothetical protein
LAAYPSLPGRPIFRVNPGLYLRVPQPRYAQILRWGEAIGVLMGEAGKTWNYGRLPAANAPREKRTKSEQER